MKLPILEEETLSSYQLFNKMTRGFTYSNFLLDDYVHFDIQLNGIHIYFVNKTCPISACMFLHITTHVIVVFLLLNDYTIRMINL